ncbi:hypothetical protein VTK73DRAFT_2171 [Phialemonium thermophilum]|uniref:Uncharacterized protein n=1 Tax=Phialemonium thermophilum TaxID=223376 RepID=A0ABR3VSM9_9PEZI
MTDASAERAASENAAEAKEEGHGEQQTTAAETTTTTANEEAPKTEESNGQPKPEGEEGDAPKPEDDQAEANAEEKPKEDGTTAAPNAETNTTAAQAAPSAETTTVTERQSRRVRRDIEVGLERFLFADRAEIDRIVTGIYRTVQGIEDMYMRPACWENLVFVGNGARLRGLKDNIIQTLNARHLISPSTATMFTSELPSNLGTPSGTGSQTPTSTFAGSGGGHQLPTSSNVNPLLQAATTANLGAGAGAPGGGQGTPGGEGAGGQPSHHFHSQTPTAIKLAQLPTYLSEWSKHGFEEAMFLGAQVAARLAFCVHNLDAQGLEAQRMMSLSRVDYNELGPKGIRSHSMLG